MNLSVFQEEIIKRIGHRVDPAQWEDWKWQMRNRIRDVATVERLTGVKLDAETKQGFDATIAKFPFSVTP